MSSKQTESFEQRFDRGRKITAIIAIAGLILVVLLLSFSDRTAKPSAINGDMLGQDSSESIDEYSMRAAKSVEQASETENSYALVTFDSALSPQAAAEALEGVDRVNAMVMLSAPAMPLAEPISGNGREDVFEHQIDQVDAALAGIGDISAPRELNGVVVWDDGTQLRELASRSQIFSVEVLPPDAAWGGFGVRPVYLE